MADLGERYSHKRERKNELLHDLKRKFQWILNSSWQRFRMCKKGSLATDARFFNYSFVGAGEKGEWEFHGFNPKVRFPHKKAFSNDSQKREMSLGSTRTSFSGQKGKPFPNYFLKREWNFLRIHPEPRFLGEKKHFLMIPRRSSEISVGSTPNLVFRNKKKHFPIFLRWGSKFSWVPSGNLVFRAKKTGNLSYIRSWPLFIQQDRK